MGNGSAFGCTFLRTCEGSGHQKEQNCIDDVPRLLVLSAAAGARARMIKGELIEVISLTRGGFQPCSTARPRHRFQYSRPGIKVAPAWTELDLFNL
jgi:hypothetical protein